jgi:hypothetical protein
MRRTLVATFVGLVMSASVAFAADEQSAASVAPAMAVAASALAPRADAAAGIELSPRITAQRRPRVLPALYATSAFLQGYDAYSTLTALKAGAVEANPLMKSITKHPAAFVGLKAGVATLSILAAEQMWKRHNRVGAVLTMVASNSLMAMVAANNARVIGRVK